MAKECLFCRKKFVPIKYSKYCGNECRRKHWRKLNPEMNLAQQRRAVEKRKNDPTRYSIYLEKGRAKGKTPQGRFTKYKAQAVNRKIPFLLTRKQFMTFWNLPCHYCGDEIEGVGLDRVDNSKGYELSNCVPCCTDCNKMKMTKTVNEFLQKCKQIINYMKK